jgi:DNA-binding XRE family transcriptional regulator
MDEPNAENPSLATPRIALQDCNALPQLRRNMTGEELKRIRLYNTELLGRYLRQEDFAKLLGVTRDTITRAETHGVSPGSGTLRSGGVLYGGDQGTPKRLGSVRVFSMR